MRSPKVTAALAAALAVVAAVFVVIDGPRAAVFPAVCAICWGLSIYLDARYPRALKQWNRRRVIDTAVVFGLILALLVVGTILATPLTSTWAFPVTVLVTLVFEGPRMVAGGLDPRRSGQQRAPRPGDPKPGAAG